MDYTFSISNNAVTIREARSSLIKRVLYKENIQNAFLSGETISLVSDGRTYVYDINTGANIRILN